MSSVTGNPPTGVEDERPQQAAAVAPTAGPPESPATAAQQQGAASELPARSCSHCGSALAPGQEWCLHCGAATRGSLENPRWRSSTAIAAAVAALALGAAAAAYAALEQHAPKREVRTLATTTPAATTPATPALPPSAPKTTVPATPAHPKLPIPLQKTKLPKIPLTAPVTPTKTAGKGNTSAGQGNTGSGKSEGEATNKGGEGAGNGETSEPVAIVLDTNAASTYNPYGLPASGFGDPSLVIDGATTTAWSAAVDPATAPAMEEGVLLNLNSPQKLSAMKLVTQTTGMTVQVYGSTLSTPPESIVNSGWTALSAPRVVKKHDVRIKLGHQKKGFRYLTLWISKAPAGDTGSTQTAARVYVNELEVFPAG